jgi:hypothetical protein
MLCGINMYSSQYSCIYIPHIQTECEEYPKNILYSISSSIDHCYGFGYYYVYLQIMYYIIVLCKYTKKIKNQQYITSIIDNKQHIQAIRKKRNNPYEYAHKSFLISKSQKFGTYNDKHCFKNEWKNKFIELVYY